MRARTIFGFRVRGFLYAAYQFSVISQTIGIPAACEIPEPSNSAYVPL